MVDVERVCVGQKLAGVFRTSLVLEERGRGEKITGLGCVLHLRALSVECNRFSVEYPLFPNHITYGTYVPGGESILSATPQSHSFPLGFLFT